MKRIAVLLVVCLLLLPISVYAYDPSEEFMYGYDVGYEDASLEYQEKVYKAYDDGYKEGEEYGYEKGYELGYEAALSDYAIDPYQKKDEAKKEAERKKAKVLLFVMGAIVVVFITVVSYLR